MKWPYLLIIFTHLAVAEEVKELSERELKNKFISVIKDHQVGSSIEKTSQFQECRNLNKFGDNSKDAQAAVDCFKKKIEGQDPKALEKLGNDLKLHEYGLIQSKNVQEISNYLTNKMYESMTGVKREEQDKKKLIESMKFKNKKMIDQKIFVEIYQSMVAKAALYEISRFCFEDFRIDAGTTISNYTDQVSLIHLPNMKMNDSGNPKFASSIDVSNQQTIYKDISSSLGPVDTDKMYDVFSTCFNSINDLCKAYVDKSPSKPSIDVSKLTGKACITKDRLQEMRKAHANAILIQNQFKQMSGEDVAIALDKAQNPKFFNPGYDKNSSIDDLTNISSKDMLAGNSGNSQKDKDCLAHPENPDCEGYVVVDDSKEKVLHDNEMELKFKRELELAKIKKMDKANLPQYLKDNGYLDLAEECEKNGCPNIEEEMKKIYEAKIQATQKALTDSIGRRQISEKEAQGEGKKNAISQNIKDAQEEKARLAQVVLFNNIISSKLTLKQGDQERRNINSLKKEITDLNSGPDQIQQQFFSGLDKSIGQDSGNGNNDGAIKDMKFLDTVLGASGDKKN
ncbi:MAG: hypothetical protein AB7I27_07820 [Bacteriovoracaceae bacterium]